MCKKVWKTQWSITQHRYETRPVAQLVCYSEGGAAGTKKDLSVLRSKAKKKKKKLEKKQDLSRGGRSKKTRMQGKVIGRTKLSWKKTRKTGEWQQRERMKMKRRWRWQQRLNMESRVGDSSKNNFCDSFFCAKNNSVHQSQLLMPTDSHSSTHKKAPKTAFISIAIWSLLSTLSSLQITRFNSLLNMQTLKYLAQSLPL